MKTFLKIAAASALAMVATQANSMPMQFNGSVSDACIVTVNTAGTMTVDTTTYQTLGSDEVGGVAGTATMLTTGAGYQFRLDTPTTFSTAPASGNTNVTFASDYSFSGANTGTDIAGSTTTALSRGNTSIDVDLEATKGGSDTFEGGTYQATVTLICEPVTP